METKTKVNRLQSTQGIGKLLNNYYVDLRKAHEDGRKVAWTTGPPPLVLLEAMGVAYHHAPSYAAYVTGRKLSAPLLKQGQAVGYSPEMCSYEKTSSALGTLLKSGQPVDPSITLPMPDFTFTAGRVCPNHNVWCDAVSRMFNIPEVVVDVPITYHERDFDRNVAYVERYLREDTIPALEKIVGRRFDYDRLKEIIKILKQTCELRNECLEMGKHIPSPTTFFDMAMSVAVVMSLGGKPECITLYREFRDEVAQRVSQNIGAVPDEKYRLLWHHIPIWHKLGELSEGLADYGANLVLATYTHGDAFPRYTERWDPEEPLRSIAEHLTHATRFFAVGYMRDWILQMVQEYSIDGIILHNHRTCRAMDLGQSNILNAVERQLGVPGVLIDADSVDIDFYSPAQVNMRLQALLETIDTRRRGRKEI